jgi:hypothetical protein
LWQSLFGGCNIIALLVDATLSQSRAQCLLTSFRQTTQVNFFLLTLSASQLHVGKNCDYQSTICIATIGQMKAIFILGTVV